MKENRDSDGARKFRHREDPAKNNERGHPASDLRKEDRAVDHLERAGEAWEPAADGGGGYHLPGNISKICNI